MWNPSNCECDKSCDVGECLDYRNCKCRKRLLNKLVEECENIDLNKMIYNGAFNDYKKVCSSCAVYIVFVIFLIISISISSVFIYFQWYSKKKDIMKHQIIKHISGKYKTNSYYKLNILLF